MGYSSKLALSSYGICILNKLIVKVVKEEHRVRLVEELSQNITEIVQDPFGNYAITTTLEVSNQITT